MESITKRIKSQTLMLLFVLSAALSLMVSCESSDPTATGPTADPDLFADVSGVENLTFEALFRSQKLRTDGTNQLTLSGEYIDGDKTYLLAAAVYTIAVTDNPIADGSYTFYTSDTKPESGSYAAAVFRCITTTGTEADTVQYNAFSGTFTLIPSGSDLNGTLEFSAKARNSDDEIRLENGHFFRAGAR